MPCDSVVELWLELNAAQRILTRDSPGPIVQYQTRPLSSHHGPGTARTAVAYNIAAVSAADRAAEMLQRLS